MKKSIVISLFLCFWVLHSFAQNQSLERQKKYAYTLSTPFQCIYNHQNNLKPENYNPGLAATSLAYTYGQTPEQKLQLAIQLDQILKGKGLYYDEDFLPKKSDYLDTTSNQHVYYPFENYPDIYLERIYIPSLQNYIWVYSAETVAKIPDLYTQTFPFAVSSWFKFFYSEKNKRVFLGLTYFHLIGLVLLIFVPYVYFKVFNWVFAFFLRRIVGKITAEELQQKRIRKLARPISLFITFVLLKQVLPFFQFPANLSAYLIYSINISLIIFSLLMTLGIVNLIFVYIEKNINRQKHAWYVQILPFFKTLLKSIAFLISALVLLENLDINVTTLLAGLSIGGLAFALAAQDTLKNLFGSVVIFIDQPFRVGDWIIAEGIDGEVEEVGVRSTKIRTFYNSVLNVPNGRLTDMTIDNLGLRVYRRYRTNLGVTYDTPPALLKAFTEGIQQVIQNHPTTRKDFFAVRFLDYNDSSLGILLNVFFKVPDVLSEWESREILNLEILELAEFLEVRFAFPTQTLHIEEIPGQDSLSPQYQKADLDDVKLQEKLKQYFVQKKF